MRSWLRFCPSWMNRRALWMTTLSLAVLILIIIGLLHTPPVRRAALARLGDQIRKSQGIILQAGSLNYNLLSPRFVLENVSLRDAEAGDISPFLSAGRIQVRLQYSSLLRGSFVAHELRIEGLQLQVRIRRDGRGNLPRKIFEASGRTGTQLPMDSLDIPGLSLSYDDERTGLSVLLPSASLKGSVDASSGNQEMNYVLFDRGTLRWGGKRLPIDQLKLDAVLQKDHVAIRTLELASAESRIRASGTLWVSDTPRLELTAEADLEGPPLSPWIGLTEPLAGRIQARLGISGELQRLKAEGEIRSDELGLGEFRWSSFATRASLDLNGGILEFKNLTAKMYAGQLGASGRLALNGPSQSVIDAELREIDLRRLPAVKGLRALPPSRASARLVATCPGLQWGKAQAKASAAVRINPGRRSVENSTITGVFNGRIQDRRILVDIDSISGHGSGLRGFVNIGTQDQSLAAELSGTVRSVSRLIHGLETDLGKPADSLLSFPLDGAAELRAVLSGSIKDPAASIEFSAAGLSAGRIADAKLHVQGDYAGNLFHVEQARLEWRNQAVTASGEIGLGSASAPLRLEITSENASAADIIAGLGLKADVQATADAMISAGGTISDPRVNIRLEAREVKAYGEPLGNLSCEANWQGRTLEVSRLRIDKPQEAGKGMLEARGAYHFDTRAYEFSLTGEDLRPSSLRLPGDIPVLGTLQLKAEGNGSLDNPVIQAEAEWQDLQVDDYSLGLLRADLDLSDHRAKLKVESAASGAVANAEITMDEAYPFRFAVSAPRFPHAVTKNGERVATLSTAAAIRGEGLLSPPELREASAQFKDFQLEKGAENIHSEGPIDMRFAGGRFIIEPVVLVSGASRLELSGNMPLEPGGEQGEISLKGNLNLVPIPSLFSVADDFEVLGTAALDARLTGSLRDLKPSAVLRLEGGRLRNKALPGALEDIRAEVSLQDGRITLDQTNARVGDGTIRGSGDMPLEFLMQSAKTPMPASSAPAHFSVEVQKAPLSALFPLPENAGGEFSLNLTGEAGSPAVEAIDARLELSEFRVRRETSSIGVAEPSIFRMRDGLIQIEQSRWKSPHGDLQLSGTMGLTGEYPVDIRFSGVADAGVLSLLSPKILGSGSLRMDLRSHGALRNPLFSGVAEMEKGSIGLRQPRVVAEDLAFRAEIEGNRIDIRKLSGVLNGGRLHGSGTASVEQGRLEKVKIDLSGQDVFVEYPAGMKSALDLNLQVQSKDSTVVIGGEVVIREGSYVDPFDFSGGGGKVDLGGKTDSSGKVELLGSRLLYDIGVKTRQPILIDNNLARLTARADLRLVGDLGRPGLRGTVTIDRDGKVYFGGRTYKTELGVVTFASDTRVEPLFDVVATTQVNDYQVTLRLSGTGQEITTTFTSDPPLSQNDVVALLLTGKPSSESGGSGIDPAQAEKLSLVSGALNAEMSARARRRFGISQVMIQPSAISGESDPGARLTIGQNLSESLQFVYSMNLVNSADQLWYMQYDMQRHLTVRAVQQSDNTYRGDFQQDIRFGKQDAGSRSVSSSGASKLKVGKVEFTGNPIFQPSQLAKEFKIAPGGKFNFAKSRKGVDRLQKFYAKRDYLEARIHMDREDKDNQVDLKVQIEAGAKVAFAYDGADVPKSARKQVRTLWQAGVADRQRISEVEDQLRLHFAKHDFLQAEIKGKVSATAPNEKLAAFEVQPGVRFKRVETVFDGATKEHADAMASRIHQRKLTDDIYLRPGNVVEDLTLYYRQRGYYLARVEMPRFDLDPAHGTGRIVFPVCEGAVIRVGAIEFVGNKVLTAAQLIEKLPLKNGSVLEPDLLRKSVAAIAESYGRNGYRNPEIEPTVKLDEAKSAVNIAFSIHEGASTYIQSLKVEGQERIGEKYIREQLRIGENGPQNFPETSRSIRNLYNTGAFARVDVESAPEKSAPVTGSETQKVDLTVKVDEVAPYKFLYGGYYDSGRGPGVILNLENRNSLGDARVLGLRTRFDKDLQEFRLYLTQPLWRRHPFPTTGTLYYRSENDYYEGLSAQRFGFTIQQEAALSKKLILSYGYRFENVYTWYPDQHVPNPPRENVSPFTLSLTRNTRDDFLDPTRGSFISTALEYAPGILVNSSPYTRLFGQYFKYFPLFKPGYAPFQGEAKRPRTIFATGVRVGLIKARGDQQVIATERFYAGGGTTVRGFKQDTLGPLDSYGNPQGGNAMLVLNNELRFPVVSFVDAVGFVDMGNVFPLVSDFRLSELRKTAGFGLRFRTPVLMLRFDYGLKLDRRPGESRGAFFFSIGQAF